MLTLYFSGTGNTAYLAHRFSEQTGARCLSIEEPAAFASIIAEHDTIVFCYPIYGSRPPRNMREFVARHADALQGKRVVLFVTQSLFSGDGARSFLDLLPAGHVEVVYGEHFRMPNNVSNLWPLYRRQREAKLHACRNRVDTKLTGVCQEIQDGIEKRRGFSGVSRFLGWLQAKPWLSGGEALMGRSLNIYHNHCTACGLCVRLCPTKNLVQQGDTIVPQASCIVCYRCVNRCPEQAITVFFPQRPKWQYTSEVFSSETD